MARTDQQFPLRLPPELKEKLENACKESGRSKNAEAVYRLEKSFDPNIRLFSLDDPLVKAHFIALQANKYDAKLMALKYAIRVIGDTSPDLTEKLTQQLEYTKLEKDDLGLDLVNLLEHDHSILQQVNDRDLRDNLLELIYNFQYDIKNLSNEELQLKYPDLDLNEKILKDID
ncbi:Arc family DNA-binding protein [Acinetobacter sp. ANC 5383]